MFCPYPLFLRSRDVPPFGPGLPPARGPLGRLRDRLLRPIVFGTLEQTMIPPINHIRGEMGLVLVGPCAWDPPSDPPPWLDDIDRPIVLVTTSSEYQDDGRMVQVALDGLAEEPVTVVATLPADDPARVRVPANAHVERFVPHRPVLDRAVCAVAHGGMGATQRPSPVACRSVSSRSGGTS